MAVGTRDVAALSVVMKDVYKDEIQDVTVSGSHYLSQLEEADPEAFKGSFGYEWLVKVQKNPSYGVGLLDGGFVPEAGHGEEVRAKQDVRDHSTTIALTEDALNRCKKGEAAFFSVAEDLKDDTVPSLKHKINAQAFTPQIVPVTANATTSTSIVVSSVQFWQLGVQVAVGNKTTGAVTGLVTITAKNPTTNTLTVTPAITVASATDAIWYPGAGPLDNRLDSLAHAATEVRTLHGINSATYSGWAGNAVNKSGAVADLADFSALRDRMAERGAKSATATTTFGILRRFANQMQSMKQFVNAEATTLRGGFKQLYIDDIEVTAEPSAPKGYCFLYDKSKIRLLRGEYGWVTPPDGGTGIWKTQIGIDGAGKARYKFSYEATYATTLNIVYKEGGRSVGMLENCQDGKPIGDA